MSEGHGTSVDVNVFTGQTQDLHVGTGDYREGLVELIELDLLSSKTGTLDSLGDGERGGSGEAGGVTLSIGRATDDGQNGDVKLTSLLSRDQDDGAGTVRDGRRVGSSDSSAVGLESRAHSTQLGLVQLYWAKKGQNSISTYVSWFLIEISEQY